MSFSDTPLVTLKIYHTNDVHSHFSPDSHGRGGLAYLASVLRGVRQGDKNALILDAGDYYKKGSLPAQKTHDDATAEILSRMPYYDVRVVGNNEVKVGITKLLEWSKTKEPAPLISANFVDKDGKTVFPPFIILKKNGLKVGVIGLTVPFEFEKSVQADPKKDSRAPYRILKGEDVLVSTVKELRPQVDVLILLSHQPYLENVRLAEKYPQIDLVVSGHSHVLTPDRKNTGGPMVVEAGQYGQQIGVVTLVFNQATAKVVSLESTSWPVGPEMQVPDAQIQEMVKQAYEKWAPDAFQVLARTNGDLTLLNSQNPFEGSLDDWVADSLRESAGGDVGVVNREMLRESIWKGPVTKESLFLASPYEDAVDTIPLARKRFAEIFTRAISNAFKGSHMVNFAFSQAKLTLSTTPDNNEIKKITVSANSTKSTLKVVLPHYVVAHCKEFFLAGDCPLPAGDSKGDVRLILGARLSAQKDITPPPGDRVQVLSQDDTSPPPSVDDDSSTDGDSADPSDE